MEILVNNDNEETSTGDNKVKVESDFKKDGTFVPEHYRTPPDDDPTNNYSYPGNYNPNTGKISTGDPDKYLEKYEKDNSLDLDNLLGLDKEQSTEEDLDLFPSLNRETEDELLEPLEDDNLDEFLKLEDPLLLEFQEEENLEDEEAVEPER